MEALMVAHCDVFDATEWTLKNHWKNKLCHVYFTTQKAKWKTLLPNDQTNATAVSKQLQQLCVQ